MSFTSGRFVAQAQRVLRDDRLGVARNTDLAYDSKVLEFQEYCQSVFGHDQYPMTVTEDKLFSFLYYQAYRKCRRRGKKYVRGNRFDRQDYDEVSASANSNTTLTNVVGYDVVNQYLCAILKLWGRQKDNSANNVTKDQLKSERVIRLMNVVKNRKTRVARASYKEKFTELFSPYLVLQEIPRIEEALFTRNASTQNYALASLRDRFCFLMSLNGVLRGESLFKCELSDLCDFLLPDKKPHPMHVFVMRIAVGKTNKNRTLFGRAIRHKNVNLCPIGSLGFYLMYRFHITHETFDFTNNESWFDVKLLIDSSNVTANTKSIGDQAYSKVMKAVCKDLNIMSQHYVHFGRATAPVHLEMEELDPALIKVLGNWCPDTQEDRYSTKMPMKAMRVMAGFSEGKNLHFNPRVVCIPPDELCRQVFPFIEVARESIRNVNPQRATAMIFLTFLENLRSVILQDAAMMIRNGRQHALFNLPVFRSALFQKFKDDLIASVSQLADPADASVESVLPGIHSRMDNMQADSVSRHSHLHQYVSDGFSTLRNDIATLSSKVSNLPTTRTISGLLNHTATYLIEQESTPTVQNEPERPSNASTNTGGYEIPSKPSSISTLYSEWMIHIQPLESQGRAWRQGWVTSKQKLFSRVKFIVSVIEQEKFTLEEVDEMYKKYPALSSLERHLKKQLLA